MPLQAPKRFFIYDYKTCRFYKSAVKPSQFTEPEFPEIAFAGRSNVGKSSLINTLVNRKNLVKTSSRPGCTQLINFFIINQKLSLLIYQVMGMQRYPKKFVPNGGP